MKRDIKVEVDGLIEDKLSLEVKKSLHISEDIDSEVDHAAADFGFYAVLAEKAESRYQKLEFAYKKWKAELETRENSSRSRDGEKKLTESQMKALINSNEKNKSYQLKLIKLDEDRRQLKILAKAFEMKSEMVRTKSSNRRSERPTR